jgi:hypothetical protein
MRLRSVLVATVAALAFAGSAQAGWYNASWKFRKALTLNGGLVPAAQVNYPALIALTAPDAHVQANTQASGNDILFTAADGTTKLAHEIESYSSVTGALVAWVNVPALASGTNTTIYLYYGNAAAANQQNRTAVWDANFRAVWHLVETPANGVAGNFDSTSNAFTGTPQGFADGTPGSTNAVGIVAGADNFLTDTYNVPAGNTVNRMEVPDNALLRPNGDFTVEAWVKIGRLKENSHFLDFGGFQREMYLGNDGTDPALKFLITDARRERHRTALASIPTRAAAPKGLVMLKCARMVIRQARSANGHWTYEGWTAAQWLESGNAWPNHYGCAQPGQKRLDPVIGASKVLFA